MRMKKAAAVLGTAAIVTVCVLSPVFISKRQEKRLIGVMKERKIQESANIEKADELIERIGIYAKEKMKEPFAYQDIRAGDSEEYLDPQEKLNTEMQEIIETAKRQIEELEQRGILSEILDETFLASIPSYTVQTYLNEENQSVTVWKLEVMDEEGSYMLCIEEESGQMIELSVPETTQNIWEKSEEQKNRIALNWGSWIGVEDVEIVKEAENLLMCDYKKGNVSVTYEIGSLENQMYIRLN